MVSTEKDDLLRVFKFEPEKESDNFYAIVSSVDIVSQEYIFLGRRVPIFFKNV